MVLATLRDRISMLAAPCRAHDAAARIEQAVADWAVGAGLAPTPEQEARLRAARFGWLPANAFAECTVDEAALYGKWLTWLFVLDDLQDDDTTPPYLIDDLYADVLDPAPRTAIGEAFTGLWRQTSRILGPAWRMRFRLHLWQHRHATMLQACHRQAGHIPVPGRYAQMRRHTNAPFLLDLPEAILRTEIRPGILATSQWQTLFHGCNDITAWCNDVASVNKEIGDGATHNFVLVVARHEGRSAAEATAVVLDRIVARFEEVRTAAIEFPEVCEASGLDRPTTSYACRVAASFLALPRAYLDWLLMSPRYRS